MGFSGGGSNRLLPHTHDGTVAQDGGALNFNNVTQSQSSAGEVFYSDGVHLQQLAYPAIPAGETLTAAAASTAPSWAAAASGAATILVSHTELLVANSSISSTFANIPQSDVSKFFGVFQTHKSVANSSILWRVNGLSTSTYDQWIIKQKQVSTMNNWTQTGANRWECFMNLEGDTICIDWDLVFNTAADYIQGAANGRSETSQIYQTGYNTTAGQTGLTQIEFYCSSGTLGVGTTLDIYKIEI